MSSFFLNNQFTIEIKNDNKDNDVIAMLEYLFLNIGYK